MKFCAAFVLICAVLSLRAQNTENAKQDYFFHQVMVWQQKTDSLVKEIAVYTDTTSGTYFFNFEAYGNGAEMLKYFLLDSTGTCIAVMSDEEGEKRIDTLLFPYELREYWKQISEKDTFSTKINTQKTFGIAKKGSQLIEGQAYLKTFLKTNEVELLYLGEFKYPVWPLKVLKYLPFEIEWPFRLNDITDIPYQSLGLESIYDGKTIFQLEGIYATEYYLSLPQP